MEIVSSIVALKPGLYLLRHPGSGPALTVARAPGGVGRIEVMGTPGTEGAVLRGGSDCIVMQVLDGAVDLLVASYKTHAGQTITAMRLDQVKLDPAPASSKAVAAPQPPAAQARPPATEFQVPAQGISLIGHLEREGDKLALPGQMLGEPGASLRLEGFQLIWPDRPEGVDIMYGISVEGHGSMPAVKSGKFCGTRGQARRITEATFMLIGPAAARYQLEGIACFSGGYQMPVASGIALSGPSGLEHLGGLLLSVAPAKAAPGAWEPSPQTKVFKAAAAPAPAAEKPAPAARPAAAKKAAVKPGKKG